RGRSHFPPSHVLKLDRGRDGVICPRVLRDSPTLMDHCPKRKFSASNVENCCALYLMESRSTAETRDQEREQSDMRAKMPLSKWAAVKGGAAPKRGQPRRVRSRRYFLLPHWEPEPQAWSVELRVSERGPQG